MDNQNTLFDEKNCVSKRLVANVIDFLKDLTKDKTQREVGEAFGFKLSHASAYPSQMKGGKMALEGRHLEKFAKANKLDYADLVGRIQKHVLLEIVIPPKDEGSDDKGAAAENINPVIPSTNRERFLTGLQELTGIKDGVFFIKKLNESPLSVVTFKQNGHVPASWTSLVSDKDAFRKLIERHSEQVPPPAPTPTDPKKGADSPGKSEKISNGILTCKKLSEVPQQFLDAFFPACIAAGKAISLNFALEAFIGTLVVKLPHCKVSSRTADDKKAVVVVYIENGETRIEFHLDPLQVFQ